MSKEKLLKTLTNGLLYGMKVSYKLSDVNDLSEWQKDAVIEKTLCFKNIDFFSKYGKPHLRKLDLTKPLEDGTIPMRELFEIAFGHDNCEIGYKNGYYFAQDCLREIKFYPSIAGYDDENCFLISQLDQEGDCWNPPFDQKDLFDYLKSKHFNIEGLEENEFIEIEY